MAILFIFASVIAAVVTITVAAAAVVPFVAVVATGVAVAFAANAATPAIAVAIVLSSGRNGTV